MSKVILMNTLLKNLERLLKLSLVGKHVIQINEFIEIVAAIVMYKTSQTRVMIMRISHSAMYLW